MSGPDDDAAKHPHEGVGPVETTDAETLAAVVGMYDGPMQAEWLAQRPALRPHERSEIDAFVSRKTARILTVGCGNGREAFALYELGFEDVTGVDPTPGLLEEARRRASAMNVPIEFHIAAVSRLPFPDATFDVVTLFTNVYSHVTPRSSRIEALREVKRVLKPAGLLFFEATNRRNRWDHDLAISLLDMGRLVVNPNGMERGDKAFRGARRTRTDRLARSHWFKPGEVEDEVAAAGLTVVRSTTEKALVADPAVDSTAYRGSGRLAFVVRKPQV